MKKLIACWLPFIFLLFSCRDHAGGSTHQIADSLLPRVPEGYSVEVAAGAELVDFPMFATLDETGRLFVFESTGNVYESTKEALDTPQFRIKLLVDTSGDGRYDKASVFADSVGFPQGGVFFNGSLYASSAPDLLKLTDTNNDGIADLRDTLLSGWKLNVNANSLVGPELAPDGWLYMNSAIEGFDVTSKEGKRMKGETARMWRVKPDGSSLEWVSAGGMNNPVELTFTEAGEPIGTETYFTDPQGGERDALVYWIEGGVYPKPNENISRDALTLTGDLMPVVSKYSRVAPAGICTYRNTVLGDNFKSNLFSAQFNTHRVLRHTLIRDGASFKTEDEIFFWKEDEDFHPTDVLEDADGSLLIVETGGWFIKGCPLSQVSKPSLKGAIYRVKKNGVDRYGDAYGNKINWATLPPRDLVDYIEDERPFVADRALRALANKGVAAVAALSDKLKSSTSPETKTRAVFALYRTGSPEAMPAIRTALNDPDISVSVAAARCAGLARDEQALPSLIKLIGSEQPQAIRRQAATAIGQIRGTAGTTALLEAAASATDRFVNHAVIHSIILMNDPGAVRNGLAHPSANVQEAALIALDQMEGSPISFPEVQKFFSASESKLQTRALWVASHHPEWAADITGFLENRFNDSISAREEDLLKKILRAFGNEPTMQQFIAKSIRKVDQSKKLMLIDAMSNAQVKKIPAVWIEALSAQLAPGSHQAIKAKALDVVQLRGLTQLDHRLKNIASDQNSSATLRMQAIDALNRERAKISPDHFNFLYQQLTTGKEASLRQQAASVLEKSNLSEQQLTVLATQFLPKADPFLLSRLITSFEGSHSAVIGNAVVNALRASPVLDNYSEEKIKSLFNNYPPEIYPSVDSLLLQLKQVRSTRLQRLQEYESALDKGNIDRGRILFYGKATCGTCHVIGKEGGQLGPDLTSIQRDRSVHDLLEAIVYPGASFVREYETYKIKTQKGEYTGIIKSKSPEMIVLATSPQSSIQINRSDILSSDLQDISLMPQGLDKLLTRQEMADLMVFLLGQDQDPDADQRILRQASAH